MIGERQLEFVNLRTNPKTEVRYIGNSSLLCNFPEHTEHTLNSQSGQSNAIVDLIVNLSYHLHNSEIKTLVKLRELSDELKVVNQKIDKLTANLDYLKTKPPLTSDKL